MPISAAHRSDNNSHTQQWSIDAKLLWDLLIYERAGKEDGKPDQSIFAPPLTSTIVDGAHGVGATIEFNLVGSAGISGHRSVPQEIPVYAPGERPGNLGYEALSMDFDASINDGPFEMPSLMNNQEMTFLQFNDFGRAIDSWLNSESVP